MDALSAVGAACISTEDYDSARGGRLRTGGVQQACNCRIRAEE